MTQAGDLNQDDRLDGKDIILLKSLLQSDPKIREHLSAEELALLDINQDGQLDQDDLNALYAKLLTTSAQLSTEGQDKLAQLRHKLNS